MKERGEEVGRGGGGGGGGGASEEQTMQWPESLGQHQKCRSKLGGLNLFLPEPLKKGFVFFLQFVCRAVWNITLHSGRSK